MFPEGSRSKTGGLKEFKKGAALLALKTGRPIIPCAILGAHEAFPVGAKFPKLRPIKFKIGKPITFTQRFEDTIDKLVLLQETSKIREAVKEMIEKG